MSLEGLGADTGPPFGPHSPDLCPPFGSKPGHVSALWVSRAGFSTGSSGGFSTGGAALSTGSGRVTNAGSSGSRNRIDLPLAAYTGRPSEPVEIGTRHSRPRRASRCSVLDRPASVWRVTRRIRSNRLWSSIRCRHISRVLSCARSAITSKTAASAMVRSSAGGVCSQSTTSPTSLPDNSGCSVDRVVLGGVAWPAERLQVLEGVAAAADARPLVIDGQPVGGAACDALPAVALVHLLARLVGDAGAFARHGVEQGGRLPDAVQHRDHQPRGPLVVQVPDEQRGVRAEV